MQVQKKDKDEEKDEEKEEEGCISDPSQRAIKNPWLSADGNQGFVTRGSSLDYFALFTEA